MGQEEITNIYIGISNLKLEYKGRDMKKHGVLVLLFLFLFIPGLCAEPVVECRIQKISNRTHVVSFSWEVSVYSEKKWEVCDLAISFLDENGDEIHIVHDRLKLNIGNNSFKGIEICET